MQGLWCMNSSNRLGQKEIRRYMGYTLYVKKISLSTGLGYVWQRVFFLVIKQHCQKTTRWEKEVYLKIIIN